MTSLPAEPRLCHTDARSGTGPEGAGALAGQQAAKAALRRRILAARRTLSEQQREAAGRRLRDHILALPQVQMAGTVAAYYSAGTEPPSRGLVYALWKRGTYVVLPVIRNGVAGSADLDWASYEGPDSMIPASHGLLEPAEPGGKAITSADVVIVPALAVDRNGNRLGRGGGFYDRALAQVGPLIPVIALLYDDELLDTVPAGPLDRAVRMVARPNAGVTTVS
ncbi:MAG TPA: 5-formyltetrahydrofolate cyclo-ligase [Streptosporangiaceae bacterium]|nr:5-formyltetrahydrofolate cyclo-ligase [Streptosporangiaceae bacterium]